MPIGTPEMVPTMVIHRGGTVYYAVGTVRVVFCARVVRCVGSVGDGEYATVRSL